MQLVKYKTSHNEASTVFNDPLSVTFPDPSYGEERYVIIGLSSASRILVVSHTDRADCVRIISAREATRNERRFYEDGENNQDLEDELLPEYDFSNMTCGVRGKYSDCFKTATNIVLLDPDVAQAFPTSNSVNEALRLLMQIAQRQRA